MFSCFLVISYITVVYCQCPVGYVDHNGFCCKCVRWDPRTVPISDFAEFDLGACHKNCMCDLAKNSCGTDPCSCRIHFGQQGYELQQNCGCERQQRNDIKMTESAHATTIAKVTHKDNDNFTPVQLRLPKKITEMHTETSNKVVILSVKERNININVCHVKQNNEKANEAGQTETDITSSVLSVSFVVGIGLGIVYYVKRNKQRSQEDRQLININIINKSDVHIGNQHTYSVVSQQE